jgi:acyl-homoserine lactone acylase PvdQ
MKILRPILEKDNSNLSKKLKNWDMRYTKDSKEGVLFDLFYKKLQYELLGKIYDKEIIDFIYTQFFYYYQYFDRLALDYSFYLKNVKNIESQTDFFKKVWDELKNELNDSIDGLKTNSFYMSNLFFKAIIPEKIGAMIGIHQGPYYLEGSKVFFY